MMNAKDCTVKMFECNHNTLAHIVEALVVQDMKDNGEAGIVTISVNKRLIEFKSNRERDPVDARLYKYFDFARGVHKGLVYGL